MKRPVCSRLEEYRCSFQMTSKHCIHRLLYLVFEKIHIVCISEHWKEHITDYSIWSLARSQKRLVVCHLVLTLSTGYWRRRKFWTRLVPISISLLQDTFQGSENKSGLILWNTSPYMLVERESLLYSLESLVAEFGGTLSLFLGFSFMTLWDGAETIFRVWSGQSNNNFKC